MLAPLTHTHTALLVLGSASSLHTSNLMCSLSPLIACPSCKTTSATRWLLCAVSGTAMHFTVPITALHAAQQSSDGMEHLSSTAWQSARIYAHTLHMHAQPNRMKHPMQGS